MWHVLVLPFRTVVTFQLASAGVVRAVRMLADGFLSQEFTPRLYYFSFHLWFIIFERAVFASSVRQSYLFFFF